MQKNIISGKIISSKVYPLIYDDETGTPETNLRSIAFYRDLIKNPESYTKLNDSDKIIVSIGLRDLYIASEINLLSDEEVTIFKKLLM